MSPRSARCSSVVLSTLGGWILASACFAQAPTWVQVSTKTTPPARWSHGVAQDFIRGRTVIFGGTGLAGTFMNDTWEYDGTDWRKATPATSPAARRLCSMAYHLSSVGTLMFGGLSRGGYLNDTWLWNGVNWVKQNPTNVPPVRYNGALVYDPVRNRTVMFGGRGSTAYLNDTWEWDGKNWTRINTTNSPSVRYGNMAYDATRKRMVMFGGYGGRAIQDTWEYDGTNWTQMTPVAQPSARCCNGLAYDLVRQRIVMFGGWAGYFQETWEYDGKTWTKAAPTNSPSGRYDFDFMVYDLRRLRMILFGGLRRTGTPRYNAETWEYTFQSLSGSPPTISIATGGTQTLRLDAGTASANRLYWVFGSVNGTSPGVTLGSVNIPLNPDLWTDFTIAFANTTVLTNTRGTLDASGRATATFNVPIINDPKAIGVVFYHAHLIYDASSNFYAASNPVTLRLIQ